MSSKDAENDPREPSEGSAEAQAGAPAATGFAPMAFVRSHPRLAIAASAMLLAGIGAIATWILLRPSPLQVANKLADAALEALDEDELEKAKKLAQDVSHHADLVAPLAKANYVLGTLGAREAEKAPGPAKASQYLAAARLLEEALDHGLPEDRVGDAKWLLGRSLYEAGQLEACRKVLLEALEDQPERQAQIRQLLTTALRREWPPKLAEALEQNKAYLAIAGLTAADRHEALVQQAEILVEMGKPAESLKVLAELGPNAKYFPAVNVVEGRALLGEARALKAKAKSEADRQEATKKLQAALATLRKAREAETVYTQNGRQALYLLGVCLTEMGDPQGALDQFRELNAAEPTVPEYFAAAFQEAGLLRTMGRAADAVKAYCRALDAVRDAKEFRNPWMSAD